MRNVAELEAFMEAEKLDTDPGRLAISYMKVGEEMLENWLVAKNLVPTEAKKEGFRILAMHRQGCKGDPSFNACRETCRELAYYYNLITMDTSHEQTSDRLSMMDMVAKHLVLFIGSKMQVAEVGEFCCSAKVNKVNRRNAESNIGVSHG